MSAPTVPSKEQLADAIISNILTWKNPYDVFKAQPDTPMEDVHRKYKKISVQIHPDKCKHPQAREAFDALQRAMTILKEDDYEQIRIKYQRFMKLARDKMTKIYAGSKKKRESKADEKQFEKDVRKMTQKLLVEAEENNKRAEELKLANEKRAKEEEEKEQEKERQEKEREEKWEQGRDYRVHNWRDFQTKAGMKRKLNPEDEPLPEPVDDSPIIIKPHRPPAVISLPAPPKQRPDPPAKPILEPPKKKYAPKPLKPPRQKLT